MRARSQRSYTNRFRDTLRDAGQRLRAGVSRKPRIALVQQQDLSRSVAAAAPRQPQSTSPSDPAVLVEVMLCEGRYGLLLRSQLVGNLSIEQRTRAAACLTRQMTLVERGPVVVVGALAAQRELEIGRGGRHFGSCKLEPVSS